MKRLLILFLILPFLFSCKQAPNDTQSFVNKLSDQWNNVWFDNISFVQTVQFIENGLVTKTQRWFEDYEYPGNLLIRINYKDSAEGYFYTNDSVYKFEDNKIIHSKEQKHDLLFFSKDIYNTPKNDIINRMQDLGYDTTKFYKWKWKDRKVYIIGAEKGDNISNQVWYDAEHFYLHKIIKNTPSGIMEVVFDDYMKMSGRGWIEQEITFLIDGEIFMKEKYYDIKIKDSKFEGLPESRASEFFVNIIPQEIFLNKSINIIETGKNLIIFYIFSRLP